MEFSLHVHNSTYRSYSSSCILPASACLYAFRRYTPISRRISCSSFPAPPIASLSFSSLGSARNVRNRSFFFCSFLTFQITAYKKIITKQLVSSPARTLNCSIPDSHRKNSDTSSVHIRITNHIFSSLISLQIRLIYSILLLSLPPISSATDCFYPILQTKRF